MERRETTRSTPTGQSDSLPTFNQQRQSLLEQRNSISQRMQALPSKSKHWGELYHSLESITTQIDDLTNSVQPSGPSDLVGEESLRMSRNNQR